MLSSDLLTIFHPAEQFDQTAYHGAFCSPMKEGELFGLIRL